MQLPKIGRKPEDILNDLESFKAKDLPWESGRVFAYVYDPGIEGKDILKKAYSSYLTENALDPTVFPSTLKLENDIISMAGGLVGAKEDFVGNFTTGGTESIMLAIKSARDYFRHIKPEIKTPEIVVPHTAHAAFHKACQFLGLKAIVVPVDKTTYKAIPEEMEKAITPNTILLVGSAPSYAQGVVDPIPEMAAIAHKHGILFHTDACVGGLFLPFAKRAGYDIPDFDLSVPGVTSLSMDFHKFGYAAKGASAVLYNARDLRRFQIFTHSGWAGYTVINTTVLSTKGGGPLAACWAILNLLGEEGYTKIIRDCREGTEKIINWVKQEEGLKVLGEPVANLVAVASDKYSVFRISDLMRKKGWFLQPQLAGSTSQENIHFSIGAGNVEHIDSMLNDWKEIMQQIRDENRPDMVPDMEMLIGMLENATPDTFTQMETALGLQGADLPDELEPINQVLNRLPVDLRNQLLTEYFNRLYNN